MRIIIIALFVTSFAFSQSGNIIGKVIKENGAPIAQADIIVESTSIGTYTKTNGAFKLENLPPGPTSLTISSIGYKSEKLQVEVVANQTISIPDIILRTTTENLDEVFINGEEKSKYVKRQPSSSLRLKTPLVKLPQNIQVISGEVLADQQVTSIMDGVIRNVSGASMVEHWGNYARINMRGFRIPPFRNGINMQHSWGPLAEDMSVVERIEFVKGPAGFMMSAGEPGGFYNVVTKKPTAKKIAEASFMVGSFNTYRGTLDIGGKLTEDEKLLFRFNGMYQQGESHRDFEKAERYSIAPSISYAITDKTTISTELNIQQAESYFGSAYIFSPVSPGYGSLDRDFTMIDSNYPATDIQEISLFTNIKHHFNENWTIESQYAHMRYDQTGNSTWVYGLEDNGDVYRTVNIWDALLQGNYFQAYLSGTFNTGGISHKVMGGFDYSQKQYWADWNQAATIDVNEPFNIYNPVYGNTVFPTFDRSTRLKHRADVYISGDINRGYYVQNEIGFVDDKIRLTLAGRYSELATIGKSETDTKLTPRAGLSIDILPSLTAYALYDQSFLAATGTSASGENFDPIEANDIEGGIKKSFFEGRLKTSLGAYIITKENVLVTDPDNPNFSVQLGEVQSKGIEFDLQGQITPELNVIFNYANTNVEITEDTNPDNIGNKVAGHAKHLTNGWLNYNFAETSKLKGFGISLGYQYQVDRSSWSWGAENKTDLPDYFRMDGALSWKNQKFTIRLNVNNILDEYLYSGANYGTYLYWQSEPGINGRLSVAYKF